MRIFREIRYVANFACVYLSHKKHQHAQTIIFEKKTFKKPCVLLGFSNDMKWLRPFLPADTSRGRPDLPMRTAAVPASRLDIRKFIAKISITKLARQNNKFLKKIMHEQKHYK